jgi:hypothetical protein
MNGEQIMIWKEAVKAHVKVWYYHSVCMDLVRKTTKALSQDRIFEQGNVTIASLQRHCYTNSLRHGSYVSL